MNTYQIALPTPIYETFSYKSDDLYEPGQFVVVPIRGRSVIGMVTDEPCHYKGALREILQPLPITFNSKHQRFLKWLSDYTLTPLGLCTKLPFPIKELDKLEKDKIEPLAYKYNPLELTQEQQDAYKAISLGTFTPYLLDGTTGSGKTEVYFQLLEDILKQKGQALVMLPEIALSEQWIIRFEKRFGVKPYLWHSQTPMKKRRAAFKAIYEGQSAVVVGARSSLFLPFQNLQSIIVDEEHDLSYKQEEQLIYNARDSAVMLGKIWECPVVLASATPSLETYHNALEGRYKHLMLKARFGEMPTLHVLDLRSRDSKKNYISEPLARAVEKSLGNNEQILLFLNKRGFAPLTLCRACGHRFECKSCSAWLIHHNQKLMCHHCGHKEPYPLHCVKCGVRDQLIPCGPGVERILEEAKELFPNARFLVMSSDMVTSQKALGEAINKILNNEVDIIIGTQIMAKGHHFPKLTTIGIIDGDMGLSGMDLRASEKTFQLLFQVSGRAGREDLKGNIYLQTYNPEHPVIQSLKSFNRDVFFETELKQRSDFHMPPYSKLISVTLASLSKEALSKVTYTLDKKRPYIDGVMILGPTTPIFAQLRGYHRQRFLIISKLGINRHQIVKDWVLNTSIPKTVRLHIDVDPVNFV